ncbi:MAG: inositol monophosphatase family protein [Actinomycetes bacterium]|nr:MAG: histidinol phosphatase [Actinomycetota bacterium]
MTSSLSGAYASDLELALSIADEVDALTVAGAQGVFEIEMKPDDTPVTAIDRAAEKLVRDRLTSSRPADAVVGEEYGSSGESARRWVIDPIDGTKNFVRRVPVWGTLIALLDRDEEGRDVCAVGVVSAPALGRRWYAAVGSGAWCVTSLPGFAPEPRPLSVSHVAEVSQASLSFSDLDEWGARRPGILALQDAVWRSRAYGDFWSYMMVAEGVVDIATEPELELYDMAALVPIVTEAGGRFTGLDGADGPFSGSALATNGHIHERVLTILSGR